MGHIFISYSHQDKAYAHKLHRHLLDQGFDAWIDDRIDYGSGWTKEIERHLRQCSAFILVMSQNSYDSDYVQNEVLYAKKYNKPIFPLLLEGEVWWTVAGTQYADAQGGKLPPSKFYVRLAEVAPRSETAQKPVEVAPSRPKPQPKPPIEKPAEDIEHKKLSVQVWIAIIGAAATIFAALLANWDRFAPASPTMTAAAPEATATNYQLPMTNTPAPPTETPIPPTPTLGVGSTLDSGGVTMMFVPAGEFTMGSNADDDEKPIHQVYLDAFWIDQTEVTNERYAKCVSAGACEEPSNKSSYKRDSYYGNSEFNNYPVLYVDWNMAKTYCEWRGDRLPTEAEWEKAARWQPSPSGGGQGGGEALTYPWGEGIDCNKANYYYSCVGGTSKVGSYLDGISPYGLYDMAGNVWEWTSSLYKSYPYLFDDGRENLNASGNRALRGGSWYGSDDLARASFRLRYNPAYSSNDVGFRCSRSLP